MKAISTSRLAGVLLAVLPLGAGAAESVRLDLHLGPRTADCPEEAELRAAVSARLGYEPWSPDAARTLRARIDREAGVLTGRVEVFEDGGRSGGERVIRSPAGDCRELAAAMSLAISLAIDPLRALVPTPPTEEGEPPMTPWEAPEAEIAREELQPPPGPVLPAPPPPEPTVAELSAGGGIAAAIGLAPSVAASVRLRAAARWARLGLGLEGRYDPPASALLDAGRLGVSTTAASLLPCAHVGSLATCVQLMVGAVRAEGLEGASTGTRAFSAVGARLEWTAWRWASANLLVAADFLAPMTRIHVEDEVTSRQVWSTPAASGALGLLVEFPVEP